MSIAPLRRSVKTAVTKAVAVTLSAAMILTMPGAFAWADDGGGPQIISQNQAQNPTAENWKVTSTGPNAPDRSYLQVTPTPSLYKNITNAAGLAAVVNRPLGGDLPNSIVIATAGDNKNVQGYLNGIAVNPYTGSVGSISQDALNNLAANVGSDNSSPISLSTNGNLDDVDSVAGLQQLFLNALNGIADSVKQGVNFNYEHGKSSGLLYHAKFKAQKQEEDEMAAVHKLYAELRDLERQQEAAYNANGSLDPSLKTKITQLQETIDMMEKQIARLQEQIGLLDGKIKVESGYVDTLVDFRKWATGEIALLEGSVEQSGSQGNRSAFQAASAKLDPNRVPDGRTVEQAIDEDVSKSIDAQDPSGSGAAGNDSIKAGLSAYQTNLGSDANIINDPTNPDHQEYMDYWTEITNRQNAIESLGNEQTKFVADSFAEGGAQRQVIQGLVNAAATTLASENQLKAFTNRLSSLLSGSRDTTQIADAFASIGYTQLRDQLINGTQGISLTADNIAKLYQQAAHNTYVQNANAYANVVNNYNDNFVKPYQGIANNYNAARQAWATDVIDLYSKAQSNPDPALMAAARDSELGLPIFDGRTGQLLPNLTINDLLPPDSASVDGNRRDPTLGHRYSDYSKAMSDAFGGQIPNPPQSQTWRQYINGLVGSGINRLSTLPSDFGENPGRAVATVGGIAIGAGLAAGLGILGAGAAAAAGGAVALGIGGISVTSGMALLGVGASAVAGALAGTVAKNYFDNQPWRWGLKSELGSTGSGILMGYGGYKTVSLAGRLASYVSTAISTGEWLPVAAGAGAEGAGAGTGLGAGANASRSLSWAPDFVGNALNNVRSLPYVSSALDTAIPFMKSPLNPISWGRYVGTYVTAPLVPLSLATYGAFTAPRGDFTFGQNGVLGALTAPSEIFFGGVKNVVDFGLNKTGYSGGLVESAANRILDVNKITSEVTSFGAGGQMVRSALQGAPLIGKLAPYISQAATSLPMAGFYQDMTNTFKHYWEKTVDTNIGRVPTTKDFADKVINMTLGVLGAHGAGPGVLEVPREISIEAPMPEAPTFGKALWEAGKLAGISAVGYILPKSYPNFSIAGYNLGDLVPFGAALVPVPMQMVGDYYKNIQAQNDAATLGILHNPTPIMDDSFEKAANLVAPNLVVDNDGTVRWNGNVLDPSNPAVTRALEIQGGYQNSGLISTGNQNNNAQIQTPQSEPPPSPLTVNPGNMQPNPTPTPGPDTANGAQSPDIAARGKTILDTLNPQPGPGDTSPEKNPTSETRAPGATPGTASDAKGLSPMDAAKVAIEAATGIDSQSEMNRLERGGEDLSGKRATTDNSGNGGVNNEATVVVPSGDLGLQVAQVTPSDGNTRFTSGTDLGTDSRSTGRLGGNGRESGEPPASLDLSRTDSNLKVVADGMRAATDAILGIDNNGAESPVQRLATEITNAARTAIELDGRQPLSKENTSGVSSENAAETTRSDPSQEERAQADSESPSSGGSSSTTGPNLETGSHSADSLDGNGRESGIKSDTSEPKGTQPDLEAVAKGLVAGTDSVLGIDSRSASADGPVQKLAQAITDAARKAVEIDDASRSVSKAEQAKPEAVELGSKASERTTGKSANDARDTNAKDAQPEQQAATTPIKEGKDEGTASVTETKGTDSKGTDSSVKTDANAKAQVATGGPVVYEGKDSTTQEADTSKPKQETEKSREVPQPSDASKRSLSERLTSAAGKVVAKVAEALGISSRSGKTEAKPEVDGRDSTKKLTDDEAKRILAAKKALPLAEQEARAQKAVADARAKVDDPKIQGDAKALAEASYKEALRQQAQLAKAKMDAGTLKGGEEGKALVESGKRQLADAQLKSVAIDIKNKQAQIDTVDAKNPANAVRLAQLKTELATLKFQEAQFNHLNENTATSGNALIQAQSDLQGRINDLRIAIDRGQAKKSETNLNNTKNIQSRLMDLQGRTQGKGLSEADQAELNLLANQVRSLLSGKDVMAPDALTSEIEKVRYEANQPEDDLGAGIPVAASEKADISVTIRMMEDALRLSEARLESDKANLDVSERVQAAAETSGPITRAIDKISLMFAQSRAASAVEQYLDLRAQQQFKQDSGKVNVDLNVKESRSRISAIKEYLRQADRFNEVTGMKISARLVERMIMLRQNIEIGKNILKTAKDKEIFKAGPDGKYEFVVAKDKAYTKDAVVINETLNTYVEAVRAEKNDSSFTLEVKQVLAILDGMTSKSALFEMRTGFGKTAVILPLQAVLMRQILGSEVKKVVLVFTDDDKAKSAFKQESVKAFFDRLEKNRIPINREMIVSEDVSHGNVDSAQKKADANIVFTTRNVLKTLKLTAETGNASVPDYQSSVETYRSLTDQTHGIFDEAHELPDTPHLILGKDGVSLVDKHPEITAAVKRVDEWLEKLRSSSGMTDSYEDFYDRLNQEGRIIKVDGKWRFSDFSVREFISSELGMNDTEIDRFADRSNPQYRHDRASLNAAAEAIMAIHSSDYRYAKDDPSGEGQRKHELTISPVSEGKANASMLFGEPYKAAWYQIIGARRLSSAEQGSDLSADNLLKLVYTNDKAVRVTDASVMNDFKSKTLVTGTARAVEDPFAFGLAVRRSGDKVDDWDRYDPENGKASNKIEPGQIRRGATLEEAYKIIKEQLNSDSNRNFVIANEAMDIHGYKSEKAFRETFGDTHTLVFKIGDREYYLDANGKQVDLDSEKGEFQSLLRDGYLNGKRVAIYLDNGAVTGTDLLLKDPTSPKDNKEARKQEAESIAKEALFVHIHGENTSPDRARQSWGRDRLVDRDLEIPHDKLILLVGDSYTAAAETPEGLFETLDERGALARNARVQKAMMDSFQEAMVNRFRVIRAAAQQFIDQMTSDASLATDPAGLRSISNDRSLLLRGLSALDRARTEFQSVAGVDDDLGPLKGPLDSYAAEFVKSVKRDAMSQGVQDEWVQQLKAKLSDELTNALGKNGLDERIRFALENAMREKLEGSSSKALSALQQEVLHLQDTFNKAATREFGSGLGKYGDIFQAYLARMVNDRVAFNPSSKTGLFVMKPGDGNQFVDGVRSDVEFNDGGLAAMEFSNAVREANRVFSREDFEFNSSQPRSTPESVLMAKANALADRLAAGQEVTNVDIRNLRAQIIDLLDPKSGVSIDSLIPQLAFIAGAPTVADARQVFVQMATLRSGINIPVTSVSYAPPTVLTGAWQTSVNFGRNFVNDVQQGWSLGKLKISEPGPLATLKGVGLISVTPLYGLVDSFSKLMPRRLDTTQQVRILTSALQRSSRFAAVPFMEGHAKSTPEAVTSVLTPEHIRETAEAAAKGERTPQARAARQQSVTKELQRIRALAVVAQKPVGKGYTLAIQETGKEIKIVINVTEMTPELLQAMNQAAEGNVTIDLHYVPTGTEADEVVNKATEQVRSRAIQLGISNVSHLINRHDELAPGLVSSWGRLRGKTRRLFGSSKGPTLDLDAIFKSRDVMDGFLPALEAQHPEAHELYAKIDSLRADMKALQHQMENQNPSSQHDPQRTMESMMALREKLVRANNEWKAMIEKNAALKQLLEEKRSSESALMAAKARLIESAPILAQAADAGIPEIAQLHPRVKQLLRDISDAKEPQDAHAAIDNFSFMTNEQRAKVAEKQAHIDPQDALAVADSRAQVVPIELTSKSGPGSARPASANFLSLESDGKVKMHPDLPNLISGHGKRLTPLVLVVKGKGPDASLINAIRDGISAQMLGVLPNVHVITQKQYELYNKALPASEQAARPQVLKSISPSLAYRPAFAEKHPETRKHLVTIGIGVATLAVLYFVPFALVAAHPYLLAGASQLLSIIGAKLGNSSKTTSSQQQNGTPALKWLGALGPFAGLPISLALSRYLTKPFFIMSAYVTPAVGLAISAGSLAHSIYKHIQLNRAANSLPSSHAASASERNKRQAAKSSSAPSRVPLPLYQKALFGIGVAGSYGFAAPAHATVLGSAAAIAVPLAIIVGGVIAYSYIAKTMRQARTNLAAEGLTPPSAAHARSSRILRWSAVTGVLASPSAAYAWGGAVAANPPYVAAAVAGLALAAGLYKFRRPIKKAVEPAVRKALEAVGSNA